jgi:hypothetical protein
MALDDVGTFASVPPDLRRALLDLCETPSQLRDECPGRVPLRVRYELSSC